MSLNQILRNNHSVVSLKFTCLKLTIEALEQGVKYVEKLTIKISERPQWLNFKHVIAGRVSVGKFNSFSIYQFF